MVGIRSYNSVMMPLIVAILSTDVDGLSDLYGFYILRNTESGILKNTSAEVSCLAGSACLIMNQFVRYVILICEYCKSISRAAMILAME